MYGVPSGVRVDPAGRHPASRLAARATASSSPRPTSRSPARAAAGPDPTGRLEAIWIAPAPGAPARTIGSARAAGPRARGRSPRDRDRHLPVRAPRQRPDLDRRAVCESFEPPLRPATTAATSCAGNRPQRARRSRVRDRRRALPRRTPVRAVHRRRPLRHPPRVAGAGPPRRAPSRHRRGRRPPRRRPDPRLGRDRGRSVHVGVAMAYRAGAEPPDSGASLPGATIRRPHRRRSRTSRRGPSPSHEQHETGESDQSEGRYRATSRGRRKRQLEQRHGVSQARLYRPEWAVSAVGGDERPLGQKRYHGEAQPAVASSREGTPPDVDDGTQKRHGDCSVAASKRPSRRRQPRACHARENGRPRWSCQRSRRLVVISLRAFESGRQDLNLRPPGPQPGALPDCATPRGCLASGRRESNPP